MRNFARLQRRYLTNVIPRVLGACILDLQRITVDQFHTGIRRHDDSAGRQNCDATSPCDPV